MVSARLSLSAVWGCLAVAERDISRKVIAWPYPMLDLTFMYYFSRVTPVKSRLFGPAQDYRRFGGRLAGNCSAEAA
jgi:hypothetical protein